MLLLEKKHNMCKCVCYYVEKLLLTAAEESILLPTTAATSHPHLS